MTLSENYLMENAENSVSEAFKFQNGLGYSSKKSIKLVCTTEGVSTVCFVPVITNL